MTHPLDGLLAFLGALAFIGAIIGIPICMAFEWSMNATDTSFDKNHKSTYPVTATVIIITAVLFIIVIVLAFINQALP